MLALLKQRSTNVDAMAALSESANRLRQLDNAGIAGARRENLFLTPRDAETVFGSYNVHHMMMREVLGTAVLDRAIGDRPSIRRRWPISDREDSWGVGEVLGSDRYVVPISGVASRSTL